MTYWPVLKAFPIQQHVPREENQAATTPTLLAGRFWPRRLYCENTSFAHTPHSPSIRNHDDQQSYKTCARLLTTSSPTSARN